MAYLTAAGAVVERESLLKAVWGDRAPSDEPLTRCIGELRRALGDTRTDPEYILTVPKRGYRLLQPGVAISELWNNGEEERRIQPKTMDVLLCLADAAGAGLLRQQCR